MDNKYEYVEFLLGSNIEYVVNRLFDYREKGKLVVTKFNGTRLYSDTVTMDEAYKAITGMTKTEFEKYLSN
ncbi:hypothetical protein P4V41_07505 [Fictibacillus nanhaiensis]|uniref:hypothetical protein n=1 Tax=Fictibacillus nanhaiensis TaxID=742169 RepID=UPI002E2215E9|nr:hypothetical protein [Fictibacillus nanhaiensis]